MPDAIVILITASSVKEAKKISEGLLKKRLAACVNVVPRVNSAYWWKGRIEKTSEALLLVKSRRTLIGKLTREVKRLHSYTVPEVIALPIIGGNTNYLKWLMAETKK